MDETEREWAALLRAANAGDGQAYASFLRRVTPVLRGIIRARGRSVASHLHEDIVQEVLLAIHAKRHTWREDHPVRPWLFAIARYKTVDAFRRRGAALHLPVEAFVDVLEAEPSADPFAARDSARLIARLDRRSADIVRSISLEGEETAEVGERLGMTEGAVRVALHRAMKRLAILARGNGM